MMNPKRLEVKKGMEEKDNKAPSAEEDQDVDDAEDEAFAAAAAAEGEVACFPDGEKKKRATSSGTRKNGSREAFLPSCQAEKCSADLSDAKRYHRRHKVCEVHAKAPTAIVAGLRQRFCQQCSRFHELTEFDESKRSCRRRLAGHNERRRKSFGECYGEHSGPGPVGSQTKDSQCRQSDERGRVQISLPGNQAIKQFHMR